MDNQVTDQVYLKLGQTKYQVISYSFKIEQPQQNGQPFGKPKVESCEVKVISDGNDSTLMAWGIDSVKRHDGSIDFMSNNALISQITFTKTYCIGYQNEGTFDFKIGNSSIVETIEIIPATLVWKDARYELTA